MHPPSKKGQSIELLWLQRDSDHKDLPGRPRDELIRPCECACACHDGQGGGGKTGDLSLQWTIKTLEGLQVDGPVRSHQYPAKIMDAIMKVSHGLHLKLQQDAPFVIPGFSETYVRMARVEGYCCPSAAAGSPGPVSSSLNGKTQHLPQPEKSSKGAFCDLAHSWRFADRIPQLQTTHQFLPMPVAEIEWLEAFLECVEYMEQTFPDGMKFADELARKEWRNEMRTFAGSYGYDKEGKPVRNRHANLR
jgi:hypothetical protein